MRQSESTESIEVVETDSAAPASAPTDETTAPAASKPTASADAPAEEPVTDKAKPEGSDEPEGDPASAKSGDDAPAKPGRWEKRVDRLTARLSERDRELTAERERANQAEARLRELEAKQVEAIQKEARPRADDYDTTDEFEDSLADWKIRQREAAKATEGAKQSTSEPPKKPADGQGAGAPAEPRKASDKELASYIAAKAKYPDIDEVFSDPTLPWSPDFVDAVSDLENSAEILYHLGTDTEEMERIAALPRTALIREVGKFADRVAAKLAASTDTPAEPDPKPDATRSDPQARQQPGARVTQAKPVPRPVNGASPGDPDPSQMSDEQYIAWQNERSERRTARR